MLIILGIGCSEQEGYYCGDVMIGITSDCMCGNNTFSYQNSEKECCGRGHCAKVDGGGICDGGEVCTISDTWPIYIFDTWPCGDIMSSQDQECQCGNHTITDDEWRILVLSRIISL